MKYPHIILETHAITQATCPMDAPVLENIKTKPQNDFEQNINLENPHKNSINGKDNIWFDPVKTYKNI